MGCDIHPAIEFRESESSPWQAVLNNNPYFGRLAGEPAMRAYFDLGRNYDLFAILGNVRNGKGFAGISSGDAFDPMTDNRGVPKDISEAAREALSNEHSATWMTLTEILAYNWGRSTKHRGWVNAEQFEDWDRTKEWHPAPREYCGGGNFKQVSVDEMRDLVDLATLTQDELKRTANLRAIGHTMCLLEWEQSYTQSTPEMWTKVLPAMLKLGVSHGFDNVRLVMDFDS